MILTTLVLLPALASAQAGTSAEPKPSSSSARVQAESTQSAGLAEVAMAAAAPEVVKPTPSESPASIAPISATSSISHATVREFVKTQVSENPIDVTLRNGGVIAYGMSATPVETSAPKIIHVVQVALSEQDLAERAAVTNVAVLATVDQYGIPRNLAIAQSAGSLIDRKALAAVSQYRFTPATIDNLPTVTTVTVAIKIQK
jgi:outer membrane biosynthesis protein TonB